MTRKALVYLSLVVALSSQALADPVALKDTVPHITTTGRASAEIVPDQADIRLGVRTEQPTAEAATQITAKAATDLIAAIKSRAIPDKDIRTSFDVAAQYDNETEPQTHGQRRTFRGYVAEETIIVRVRDLQKAGRLAREMIDKGANHFSGIDYSYSKEKELRRQLDGEAIRDALAAAKTYTDAINVKLGRVLQVGDDTRFAGDKADLPARRGRPPFDTRIAIPTEPSVEILEEDITVIWEIEGTAR